MDNFKICMFFPVEILTCNFFVCGSAFLRHWTIFFFFLLNSLLFYWVFFGEEDWPRTNLGCQSSSFFFPPQSPSTLLYTLVVRPSSTSMWDATTGWLDVCMSAPRIRTVEPWATKAELPNLTTKSPGGQPPIWIQLFLI